MRLVAILGWLVLAGCGGSLFVPTGAAVQAPDRATVSTRLFDGDILSFQVANNSNGVMTILRDRVYLSRGGQRIYREPGGAARQYLVPPKGDHEVKVRFKLPGARSGERVEVHFEEALLVDGQPVPIAPIPLVVQ